MKNGVTIWTPRTLIEQVNTVSTSRDGRTYYPARPLGCDCIPCRVRAAWLVFSGRADALIWPEGQ